MALIEYNRLVGETVKSRGYDSPRRREQALATRARVLAAAGELFLARGYRATTTAAIARAAGVSEASVFAAFGSKAALLVAVIGATVAGTAEEVPLRERPEWRRLATEKDKARAAAGFAGFVRSAHNGTWRLLAMVRAAAEGDPELAAAAARAGEARRSDCEWFVTAVLGLPASRPDTADLVDVLWAQTSVEVYRLLVVESGWPAERYEAWLTVTLCREFGVDPAAQPEKP